MKTKVKPISEYDNPADFWYAMAQQERERQDVRSFTTSLNDKVFVQNYGFCDYCRSEDVKVMSMKGVTLCGGCIRKMFTGEYEGTPE